MQLTNTALSVGGDDRNPDAEYRYLNGPSRLNLVRHLDQTALARRWQISPRTLERWRSLKQGPVYLKLGGRVAYRIEDVEAYEAAQSRCGARLVSLLAGGG